MFPPQPPSRRFVSLILGLTLVVSLAGCFKWMEPANPITPQQLILCGSMPQACRNHVYLFFLLGADPIDCADLGCLRKHLQDLGFIKAYLGDWFHKDYFAKEIRKIHKEDKLARFALIGYGLGASKARKLAETLHGDGLTIDLLVYLAGSAGPRPDNVLKLVNIQGTSHLGESPVVAGAENVVYTEVGSLGCVSHPKTLDCLITELTWVASRVPVINRELPPDPFREPTPHPIGPPPAGPRDAWDFLKPKQLVNPPGPAPQQQPEILPPPKPEPPKKPESTTQVLPEGSIRGESPYAKR